MASKSPKPASKRPRSTKKANQYITKNGTTIKLHRNLSDRIQAGRDARLARKAELLKDLPKSRVKRFIYRLHPKRLYKYWFSREGGIMALKITGIGIIVVFITMIGVFAYFRKDLPNLKDISGSNIGGSIRYYDRTGQTLLWEDYDAVKRIPVQSDQIAQAMKDSTVAIEDRDFYKHGGFDVKGIVRAGWSNITGGGTTQGGSTITQQLVKLTQDWTKDRTYTRKVKELILSVELERSYSKNEILTGYLNTAPYGGIEYGVEAAARDYFQKAAKDLTLDEATFLAAIPKSPGIYSPYSADFDRPALIGRQQYILDILADEGKITRSQAKEMKKVDVLAKVKPRQNKYNGIKAPYFVLAAKEALENKYTESTVKRGGWKVTTTLDMGIQSVAEQEVAKGLTQIKRQGGDVAAFASEDVTTGQVVAIVGGVDFTNPDFGQNNYARLPLPPGSSFKPYDYAALMENTTNFGAGSVLYDSQGPIPGYSCTNKARPFIGATPTGGNCLWDYDFQYPGPLTLRYALGGSRNVPAVKAMLTTGIDKTIEVADKLTAPLDKRDGFGYKCYKPDTTNFVKENEDQCYASSAIGDGAYLKLDEHVHGFATLSRNGNNLPQSYILKIEDAGGKLIDEWKPTSGTQEIRADGAYIVSDMLSDPNASYFPAGRKPHRFNTKQGTWKFAMKTGTTNDGKDGWMMGFSTKYAAGVWVGYHTRRKAMSGTMENMTQPIWQGFMNRVHTTLTPVERVKPPTVQTAAAYVITRHVGIGSVEPSPAQDLYPAWYVAKKGASGQKQVIDLVSNKLATECTPERAKKEVTNGAADNFSGDTFAGTGGANTDAKDDVHKCDDVRPQVSDLVVSPAGSGKYNFTATVTAGTHPLSSSQFKGTLNFLIDGQIVQSQEVAASGTYTLSGWTSTVSGSHTVAAQVIDSVLYDDSIEGDFTFSSGSGGGAALKITNPHNNDNISSSNGNVNITVLWTGGSGPFTVYQNNVPYPGCIAINTASCPMVLSGSNDTSFTVKVVGGTEDSVTFKK